LQKGEVPILDKMTERESRARSGLKTIMSQGCLGTVRFRVREGDSQKKGSLQGRGAT
jgi:hypothetical protein